MSERQAILDGLKPLFKKARKEKLLFQSNYDRDIIFTPDELKKAQAEGRFVWGPVNWELIEPERIKQWLKIKVDEAQKDYQSFLERLKAAGY
jgi:hypothetical protein